MIEIDLLCDDAGSARATLHMWGSASASRLHSKLQPKLELNAPRGRITLACLREREVAAMLKRILLAGVVVVGLVAVGAGIVASLVFRELAKSGSGTIEQWLGGQ